MQRKGDVQEGRNAFNRIQCKKVKCWQRCQGKDQRGKVRGWDQWYDIVHAHDKSTQTKRFADAGTTTLADDLGSSNESYIKEFPPLSSTLSM